MNPTVPTTTVPPPAPVQTPSDQYAQLKAAVLGAQSNPAPGASPLGDFPELTKLYSSGAQLQQQQLGSAAPNYNSGVQASADAAAANASSSAASQKLKDLSDPNKYRQEQAPDGGYNFYDPLGNPISASQFASVRNGNPADILKNSQNPIDKAFVQDYNSLQTYVQNKQNAKVDTKAAAAAKATEDQVMKLYGVNLAKESPAEVINTFKAAYPTVFGGTNTGVPANSTFLPDKNYVATKSKSSVSSGAL